MRMAGLGFLTIAVTAFLFVQDVKNSASTAAAPNPNASSDPGLVRQKYHVIQVDEFAVKQGVDFPPEYLKKTQQQLVKQLSDGKVLDEVVSAGQQPRQAGVPVIRLSGTIHNYTPGSRAKRYIGGFGLGAAEVDAHIAFLDAAGGQQLHADEFRAVFTGGVFGGSDDKIAEELARRVVLQTRFMLDRRIPLVETGSTTSAGETPSSSADRHTITMNAKKWSEGDQKLEQEAAGGSRVVDFSWTGQTTADLALERRAAPSDVYQYRWVHVRLYTNLQKEVSKAAADGFHALPQTLGALGPYLTVLMEKAPGPSTIQYQYAVTEPLSLSHAQKDTATRQQEGYALLDATEFGAHILLFEKTSQGTGK
jgi:Domain of unknown function (DUF4410)